MATMPSTTPTEWPSSSRKGALLDVQLEIGTERAGHARLGAEIADPLQLVDKADSVAVARVVRVLQRDLAGHHASRDHRRLEARALLVDKDGQRDRMPRRDPVIVERADDFESAEDAELAVVLAARRHRVDV